MTFVIDASVAAKWILREEHSDRADTLRREGRLIAPALIGAEVGNALWKAVRRGEFSKEDAVLGLDIALEVLAQVVPHVELSRRALEIAIALDHPIYDCFYLALAERERAPLITADQRLARAAQSMERVEVRPL